MLDPRMALSKGEERVPFSGRIRTDVFGQGSCVLGLDYRWVRDASMGGMCESRYAPCGTGCSAQVP